LRMTGSTDSGSVHSRDATPAAPPGFKAPPRRRARPRAHRSTKNGAPVPWTRCATTYTNSLAALTDETPTTALRASTFEQSLSIGYILSHLLARCKYVWITARSADFRLPLVSHCLRGSAAAARARTISRLSGGLWSTSRRSSCHPSLRALRVSRHLLEKELPDLQQKHQQNRRAQCLQQHEPHQHLGVGPALVLADVIVQRVAHRLENPDLEKPQQDYL
jgi:hypothetical protein